MAVTVDVRGEICPYPMLKAMKAMRNLPPEETTVEVLTDHPPALNTIPPQAQRLGFLADIQPAGTGEWRIILTRR